MPRATSQSSTLVLLSIFAACAHPTTTAPPVASTATAADPAAPSTAPAAAIAAAATTTPAAATAIASGYDRPPQQVLDVLHAPPLPAPVVSPTGATILLVSWVDYPPMAQIAEPFLRLAGVRVEPRTRRKHDTPGGYGVAPCAAGFTLVDVATSREAVVALPPGGCADGVTWSADGARIAFRNTASDAVELWIADAATGKTHRLGDVRLNPMLGSTLQWMPDQKTLLVKLVPEHAGPPPAAPIAAGGPSIQETDGQSGESSTYETRDTLKSKHDEDLFEYYGTSQLALIDAGTGAIARIGKPAVYSDVDAAPDGEHILVTTIQRPYSYVTTVRNFAHEVAVWDRGGNVTRSLARLPVADRVPIHGVPTGPRDFEWRQTEPATLIWTEALDGGDWNTRVPARDKLMTQRAPFSAAPTEIVRLEQRYVGIEWGEQRGMALLHEHDENRHWLRTFVADVDDPKVKPRVLWDLSSDERYKDPGAPVHRRLPDGRNVLRQDGDAIFLRGQGATPEGDRPFLDRLDLKTGTSTRLFRSPGDALESFVAFCDAKNQTFLTWHQSPSDPPNAMLRTLGDATASSRPVTHVPDPTPAVRAIKKQLVKYKRRDGLDLSFTLYTPPNYQPGTRVPAILYAYPSDYASASSAGQVEGSDKQFTRLRNYQLLLLSGYAIIDRASFPIIGDPKKAYDTYLEQLIDDARAAVDKAVELGVVDRERIGVTGHSHGALMTANLIAHTDLFRAGVATSGAYNKTLTPFGFQSERRSVWKAPDVYRKASPFFFADKIKLPLLLMHGMEDANPGTIPMQSVTLYEAIRGNGGTTRLVMLPHEPHWYGAMESNEQLAYEEVRWFDKYVKNAPPRTRGAGEQPKAARH